MNILFLALDVKIEAKTGDAIHVRELVGSLAKLGHKVNLIAPYTDDSPEELNSLKNQQNVRIFFNKPKRHLGDVSTLSFCKKTAQENGADVIYERRFSAKMGYSLGKVLKIPYIVEINGLADVEAQMLGIIKKQNIPVRRVKKRIRRRFFMHANRIVAVTEGIKEALIADYELPSDNIVVVTNGANIDLFRKMDKMQCRQHLGLDMLGKYVCFTGNLAPWQGLDTLIKAAPMVIDKIPEAVFIIVGDGMMRNGLERTADKLNLRNRFIFKGWVPYKDVQQYINSSEVCVAPFVGDRKCSPIKIYEYLACEKPVIASSIADLEFIEETNSGLLVPPNNPAELGNALIKVMINERVAEEMGTRGRQYVVENQSWLNVAQRITKICEEVVHSNPKKD